MTLHADRIARLVLASGNQGKLREFRRLLAPYAIEVVAQGELGVTEADEPHSTFVENALEKARHASRHTRLPALADDSGICVSALGGAPGVHSAYYAGHPRSDARNNAKLVETLASGSDRRAHYACVLVLVTVSPLAGRSAVRPSYPRVQGTAGGGDAGRVATAWQIRQRGS